MTTVGGNMQEEYDFFDDRQPAGTTSQPSGPRHHPDASSRSGALAVWTRRCAGLSGLLAVAASLLAVAKAVAPHAWKALNGYSLHVLVTLGVALAALAIVLAVTCKVAMRGKPGRHSSGSGAIVAAICALMLVGGSILVSSTFPQGIIQPAVVDKAPIANIEKMEKDVEQGSGTCSGGWQEISTADHPGVGSAAVCKATRIAFVTFDSRTATAMYKSAVASKVKDLVSEYSGTSEAQGDWRILVGERWMAVGQKSDMTALQKRWGGTLGTMD
ncbi:MAG: hypothetical protein LKI77_07945 [Bifidobacterium sp.]|nr:hypothetical protein [Bifidobacterium sp.]